MKYFRPTLLVLLNLTVFVIMWVLFGNLAEAMIHKYMNDTIMLPQAFALGAVSYLLSNLIAIGIETFVEWVVWGKSE
ncbi:hypothetical protein pEaSNUABM56_00051 [Erwinia phage pEa_SNUABM_56]|uniref:Uncharacterized protein n=1 Tax=Erwinia phage pEp_SNUABM_01 TaxID=2601643 RepID=A0A5J6DAV3_9CAUD|nr:hypothetical protein HWC63_gp025 [Erwinia phage pEp_SNUABM_01]QEQ94851.1 hypothetical protein pEpSNUABM01_025 [Erwinia phage pEp_SNUABM_01]UYL85029.1 hypothetical protein pEaSNUABM55_00256 [Erwinia phage pEa_SNUABM_55]UYL85096.1 hypothetical protein pEaSNUABM56_00051 [Erwinia phage pEa_SNUABM_56]